MNITTQCKWAMRISFCMARIMGVAMVFNMALSGSTQTTGPLKWAVVDFVFCVLFVIAGQYFKRLHEIDMGGCPRS